MLLYIHIRKRSLFLTRQLPVCFPNAYFCMFIWCGGNDTRQTDCRLVLPSCHMLPFMGGWKAADGLRNLRCHTNPACADKPSQPLFSKPVIGPMCELLRRFPVHESCFSAPLRRACAECVLGVHFLECIFAAAASRLTNHRL